MRAACCAALLTILLASARPPRPLDAAAAAARRRARRRRSPRPRAATSSSPRAGPRRRRARPPAVGRAGRRDRRPHRRRAPRAAPLSGRHARGLPEGLGSLAGLVLREGAGGRAAQGDRRRSSSTTAAGRCSRRTRTTRSRGRWRAATRARSAGSSTRRSSGSRWRCCSSRRSSSRAAGCGSCTSTCSCCSAFSISLACFNAARIDWSVPLVYPLLVYLLGRMLWIGLRERDGAAGAGAAARAARAGDVAGGRRRVPARVPRRAQRHALERHRRRLRGVIGADRFADGRALYGEFPTDNQNGDTYGPAVYEAYVPVRAGAAVERQVGRPAGRARRVDRVRPAARACSATSSGGACAGPIWGSCSRTAG